MLHLPRNLSCAGCNPALRVRARARTRRTMNFVNIRGLAPADARTRCGVNFDNFRARRSQKIGPSAIARAGAPSLRDARENACRQAWQGKGDKPRQ